MTTAWQRRFVPLSKAMQCSISKTPLSKTLHSAALEGGYALPCIHTTGAYNILINVFLYNSDNSQWTII